MEVSGIVHEIGPDVENFEVGDRVVGSGGSGGYSTIQYQTLLQFLKSQMMFL